MSEQQKALRVLLVDDHPVVREGLRAMLSGEPQVEVIGDAGDGEQAIEMVTQLQPDVVLMDIRMPGMSGIEATQRIKTTRPDTAVIVLTMYDSEMYVVQALRAGAAGFLLKDSSRDLLYHAISAVVDGGTMVRSGLLRQAIQGLSPVARPPTNGKSDSVVTEQFTAREMEVLRLVAQGFANKEIAKELNLAEVTVKKYVQSVIAKLGVSDRTSAAIIAVRMGLVQ